MSDETRLNTVLAQGSLLASAVARDNQHPSFVSGQPVPHIHPPINPSTLDIKIIKIENNND